MKNIIIYILLLISTNCYTQFNLFSGLSIANFYENKYQSEKDKKIVFHAGLGYSQILFKSNLSLTGKIYYTQLGAKLDDRIEYKTDYNASCVASSIGLKFRNNFNSKVYFNVSLSPTLLYVNRLDAEIKFRNPAKKSLNLSLDEKNPKTEQWNTGIDFETGIDVEVFRSIIGINFFHTFYFDDMGGTLNYAYGGGYENNKYYFENSGIRIIYIFK